MLKWILKNWYLRIDGFVKGVPVEIMCIPLWQLFSKRVFHMDILVEIHQLRLEVWKTGRDEQWLKREYQKAGVDIEV
jgi:hypothetical protein